MPKKTSTRNKTTLNKAERLAKDVADAVGAGKVLHLESVDFSDPHRPKTCLEVDFPILPINHVAAIEGNAGKPIYQMSKWWARRRSSVFRSMLLAAATKAPEDPAEAAKLIWDSYYGNHQKNKAFRKLKVADIFMGGGTTIVEGSRLGMDMYGNDLNPVAWFIVKNEMANVDPEDVQKLLDEIENEVKPQIMPFYICDCPRGHSGKWHKGKGNGKNYEGPEVIYTFWAKHGPCKATGCHHRTPIMATPVIAVKELTVKTWKDVKCPKCHQVIDIEEKPVRMAPAAEFYDEDHHTYATLREDYSFVCPHCLKTVHSGSDAGEVLYIGKKHGKKTVSLTLLIHPDWLKGAPGVDEKGKPYGGSAGDDAESTAAWNRERAKTLKLIEVRGKLPEKITLRDTQKEFYTDHRGGTVPKKSTFACAKCGLLQDVLESIKKSGKTGPVAMYAVQGYCPTCDETKVSYGGRFFGLPNSETFNVAAKEWEKRKNGELKELYPKEELPYGFMTSFQNGGIPNHGFTHWWTMFNVRQLLGLALMLQKLLHSSANQTTKDFVLGAFQQYVRNQNMFCIWDISRDCMAPALSNSNFHPKATVVENSFFTDLGRGNWASCAANILEGAEWKTAPWDTVAISVLAETHPTLTESFKGKSTKVLPGDIVLNTANLDCSSSTELTAIKDESFDAVITDPPFGGLLHYSELADFFCVWLRLALKDVYPEQFGAPYTPKIMEVVANRARNPEDADAYYQSLLTTCWREAWRILKPSGILAFTFHHSQDEPWLNVLESLFQAGFYLEATFPIRSDEAKSDVAKPGNFGSMMIEFDIIHVCRKRLEEPPPISWARLRQQIIGDVAHIRTLLERHQEAGLQDADLKVIRRGKALEHFSRHYGNVFKSIDEKIELKEVLIGINQILDDQRDADRDAPPIAADPLTRDFLRLFYDTDNLPRDQIQKSLRGTGVAPSEFVNLNWCQEAKRIFTLTPLLDFAKSWEKKHRSGMKRDLDQALFLIGACYEGSGINVKETLANRNFKSHPALGEVLEWFTKHGADSTLKAAAKLALQLFKGSVAERSISTEPQLQFIFDNNDPQT